MPTMQLRGRLCSNHVRISRFQLARIGHFVENLLKKDQNQRFLGSAFGGKEGAGSDTAMIS
jgi:hypothetical protein